MPPLLEIEHLCISFTQYAAGLRRRQVEAIRDLSLTVQPGQVVAVVGSSGSGKSLLAHAILGILPYNSRCEGSIRYQGQPLTAGRLKRLRGRELVLVPQGVTYLDPLMKVGAQVGEGSAALARYGLGPETRDLYPFELSGGMARRVLLSTAAACQPRLVIADEPTPGLDAQAAARVLGHFRELAGQGAGVLFITHDLELALRIASKVEVLHNGRRAGREMAAALWEALPQNRFAPLPKPEPAETSGALQAQDLTFAYPRRRQGPVLEHCSLTLSPGEVLGLSAPSGRGKTTLCKLLAGYERPGSGSITLNGTPLERYKGPCPVQLIWQHPEEAVDPLLPLGETLREAGPIDRRLLDALGIQPAWLKRYPTELSGGELQRFCIARALVPSTQYLLCDENTTMLDPISQANLWSLLLSLAQGRRLGLLVVSHNRFLLKRLCTRVLEL